MEINMSKWSAKDKESGLIFSIEKAESGKFFLRTTYNNIDVNPLWYEFTSSGLDTLQLLINSVRADIDMKEVEKVLKTKKPKKK